MGEKAGRVLSFSWKVAWHGLLISLPVTSLPFLSGLLGGAQVAPLALIPLAWLVLTWLLPALLRRKVLLPAEIRPLLGFLLAALLASLLAFFIDVPPYKSHTLAGNEWNAFLTLGIGLCFYLVVLTSLRSGGFDGALRSISIGGILLLVWSLTQGVVVWFFGNQYPQWMVTVHSWFASTSLLRLAPQLRVTGLAYEPSWLAHMLNLLYLPLWAAACWHRQSSFRLRLGKLILEDLLLLCGAAVLFLTFSRISLLGFMLVLGWFLLLGVKKLSFKVFSRKKVGGTPPGRAAQSAFSLLVLLVFVIGFMGVIFGLAFFDPRLVPLFQLGEQFTSGELFRGGLMPLAIRLNFAERVVYWDLGWRIFEKYPLLGVGLGNSGQFALREVSHWGWEFMEVRRILFTETFLPNTKNLWTRLLAETGLVGTVFFLAWLVLLWHSGRSLRESPDRLLRTLGLAGGLAFIALLIEGFSLDSFAMPYWWILPGILTAAGFFSRQAGSLDPDQQKNDTLAPGGKNG